MDLDTSTPTKLSYDWNTTPEQKSFFTQTYTVFTSAQKIEQDAALSQHGSAWPSGNPASSLMPFQQTMQYYHRISGLYRSAVRDYLSQLEGLPETDLNLLHKWQAIHTTLHLAEVLYFPADGRGAGVVGEEILHWLNSFDFAPTTEEGQEIAQTAVPHSHPSYWDYVLRCVLRGFHSSAASVLKSLDAHHASAVRRTAQKAANLLSSLPRSTAYGMEHEFIAAHRAWIGRVRNVLSGLEQEMDDIEAEAGHTEESEDERLEYEAQFRCLLELMAGVKDRVFEACEDWKEALGAWGTLVQPTLKRDDVPGMVDAIFEQFPVDGTLPTEVVQSHLVKGEVARAVSKASEVDVWLAAHLGDLMHKAGLLDEANEEPSSSSSSSPNAEAELRNRLLLQYADAMLDEQGLWRISIDYLSVCGLAGRQRMREVILSVPYLTSANKSKTHGSEGGESDDDDDDDEDTAMDEGSDGEGSDAAKGKSKEDGSGFERAEAILRACADHGLEEEARVICKRLSRAMTRERRYGVAVAYCVRAGDAIQIRQISDQLLSEYVTHGASTFISLVDSIPASLLAPLGGDFDTAASVEAEGGLALKGFFSTRLAFLARYRDFHRLYAEAKLRAAAQLLAELVTSEAAPETFLAVLLVDAIPLLEAEEQLFDTRETFELMRIVEKVTSWVSAHPTLSEHYLGYLERLIGSTGGSAERVAAARSREGGEEAGGGVSRGAGEKLDVVRLGLARHLARVSVAQMGVVY